MRDQAVLQLTLAALQQELEAIHAANKLYWNRQRHSREDDMEHQGRQERLEHLREEMNKLETK